MLSVMRARACSLTWLIILIIISHCVAASAQSIQPSTTTKDTNKSAGSAVPITILSQMSSALSSQFEDPTLCSKHPICKYDSRCIANRVSTCGDDLLYVLYPKHILPSLSERPVDKQPVAQITSGLNDIIAAYRGIIKTKKRRKDSGKWWCVMIDECNYLLPAKPPAVEIGPMCKDNHWSYLLDHCKRQN